MTPHEQHPSMETLNSFSEGTLPDFQQMVLEEHLAGCEACMTLFTRIDSLLFSGFTAENHAASLEAEARAADPLVQAIREALTRYKEFGTALREWLRDTAALWSSSGVRIFEASLVPISGSAETAPVLVRLGDVQRAFVDVLDPGQTIEVESSAPAGTPVLLFAAGEEPFIRAAALEDGGPVRTANFGPIPGGKYRIAIGPSIIPDLE